MREGLKESGRAVTRWSPEADPVSLHQKAIADRDERPWRYYRLEWDVCQRMMDELLERAKKAEAAIPRAPRLDAPVVEPTPDGI